MKTKELEKAEASNLESQDIPSQGAGEKADLGGSIEIRKSSDVADTIPSKPESNIVYLSTLRGIVICISLGISTVIVSLDRAIIATTG